MSTNRLASSTLAATLAISLALGNDAAWAQSAQEHQTHQYDGAQAQATPDPMPGPAHQRGMPGMMGGQGMPMQGAPGAQQGGMTGMMGDMGRMMDMMHRQMATQHAMRAFEHIEGKLAFYRTELGVTDAQQPQWNAFADAVRS